MFFPYILTHHFIHNFLNLRLCCDIQHNSFNFLRNSILLNIEYFMIDIALLFNSVDVNFGLSFLNDLINYLIVFNWHSNSLLHNFNLVVDNWFTSSGLDHFKLFMCNVSRLFIHSNFVRFDWLVFGFDYFLDFVAWNWGLYTNFFNFNPLIAYIFALLASFNLNILMNHILFNNHIVDLSLFVNDLNRLSNFVDCDYFVWNFDIHVNRILNNSLVHNILVFSGLNEIIDRLSIMFFHDFMVRNNLIGIPDQRMIVDNLCFLVCVDRDVHVNVSFFIRYLLKNVLIVWNIDIFGNKYYLFLNDDLVSVNNLLTDNFCTTFHCDMFRLQNFFHDLRCLI